VENIWKKNTPHFDWIQVEVSAMCNAACAYCVLTCYKGQWGGGLMDMATFERLQPSFVLADMIYLQGWGEPLLHPHFWDIVRVVKSSGAKVGFTTNATPLVDKHINQLFEQQVDIMGVSLAGVTPKTHEQFRHGCDFARLEQALRKIKQQKHERKLEGPSVHLAFMVLRSNWQEIAQLPALAEKWGASQVVISHLSLIGTEAMQEESILLHPQLWPEVNTTFERAKEAAAKQGILLHYHHPHLDEPCAICTENVLHTCFISYRGDVSPCVMTNISLQPGASAQFWFQQQAYPVKNYLFGNINERPLPEIWNNAKASEFRAAFRERIVLEHPGTYRLPAPCRRCYKLLEQ
jgi:MoaA/NifB/PqqE/SkfB family radical SAM enzyme